MKKSLLIVLLFSSILGFAQDPIFNSSMSISSIGIVDSPIGEEVDKIIDGDINTKFLDFELNDGMGFTVDLGGESAIANSIEITTANDFEVRDPMNFEVLGSNDGNTFTNIDTGEIICISDRFFSRTYELINDDSYSYYQINFTDACDPSGGTGIPSIQLAETQLYTEVLSINDQQFSKNLQIIPNPNNGVFKLKYNGLDSLTNALVFDINGRIIQEINVNEFQNEKVIQLNNLKTGIYFVNVSTKHNTANLKVIIH